MMSKLGVDQKNVINIEEMGIDKMGEYQMGNFQ